MADITKVQLLRNAGKVIVATAAAASQTIVYDRSDENIVIRVVNGDAAACRVKVTNQLGGTNLDVDIAAAGVYYIGALESATYKSPSTGKVTVQVLDQDNTAFSGTVGNVDFEVLALPISLLD